MGGCTYVPGVTDGEREIIFSSSSSSSSSSFFLHLLLDALRAGELSIGCLSEGSKTRCFVYTLLVCRREWRERRKGKAR